MFACGPLGISVIRSARISAATLSPVNFPLQVNACSRTFKISGEYTGRFEFAGPAIESESRRLAVELMTHDLNVFGTKRRGRHASKWGRSPWIRRVSARGRRDKYLGIWRIQEPAPTQPVSQRHTAHALPCAFQRGSEAIPTRLPAASVLYRSWISIAPAQRRSVLRWRRASRKMSPQIVVSLFHLRLNSARARASSRSTAFSVRSVSWAISRALRLSQ